VEAVLSLAYLKVKEWLSIAYLKVKEWLSIVELASGDLKS